jgi:hypothetical protein
MEALRTLAISHCERRVAIGIEIEASTLAVADIG